MPEREDGGVSEHPPLEILSAYVDGRVDDRQRAEVEAHLAWCEDCYELVKEVVLTEADIEAVVMTGTPGHASLPDVRDSSAFGKVLPFWRRRWFVVGTGGVATAAALIAAVLLYPEMFVRFGFSRDTSIAKLVATTGEYRTVEGRLSGGSPYQSLRSAVRSGDASRNLSLLAAAGELQAAANADPTSRNLHAWGIAELLLADYDGAIRNLELAVIADRRSSSYHSDLAAAYLARARVSEQPEDLVKALAVAQTALELEPNSLESLFNKALAATALNLREEARDAWHLYLKADNSSKWAEEARQHLATVEKSDNAPSWSDEKQVILGAAFSGNLRRVESSASIFPQQLRETVEDELLARLGTDIGTSQVEQTFRAIRIIAESLLSTSRDHLLLDVAAAVEATLKHGTASNIRSLSEGLQEFGRARALYEANNVGAAAVAFRGAKQKLSASAGPLAIWCDYYTAIDNYYQGRLDEVIAVQTQIAERAEADSYAILAARAHWMIGLARGALGDHERQLEHYQQAFQRFAAAGETQNEAAIHNLMAGAFLYLGEHRLVWRHTVAALRSIGPSTPARRRHTQLASATNAAIRLGLPSAAVVLSAETLRSAQSWAVPEALIEALQYDSRARSAAGQQGQSQADLLELRRLLAKVADASIRQRLTAEVDQTEAEALQKTEPRRAVEAATRAIDYFSVSGPILRIPRLHLAEARALVEQGNISGAMRAYAQSLARFEAERDHVPGDSSLRISHFDDVWNAYRELLTLAVKANTSSAELFALAERGRARTLAERTQLSTPTLVDVQAASPRRTAIVFYAALSSNRLIAWVITRDIARLVRVDLDLDELTTLVRRLSWDLRFNSAAGRWRQTAARIYDSVIRPLTLSEMNVESIVVVPDGILHEAPFSALWNARNGRYLVQEFDLSLAPSAGFVLAAAARHTSKATIGRITAVASSAGVPALGLAPLPEADQEVQTVQRFFPNARVLTRQTANLAQLLDAMRNTDVLHFAGHALANLEYPLRSKLILSDGHGLGDEITAEQLAGSTQTLKLVVLSACGAMDGPVDDAEGPLSLARAFLSAGASEVIAARWAVDDRRAHQMVTRLYESLAAGQNTVRSLSSAIRDAIQSAAYLPSDWSQWTVIGVPGDTASSIVKHQ